MTKSRLPLAGVTRLKRGGPHGRRGYDRRRSKMDMGWSYMVAAQEAANEGACIGHFTEYWGLDRASTTWQTVEDYMVDAGADSCEEMPCKAGCPFFGGKG